MIVLLFSFLGKKLFHGWRVLIEDLITSMAFGVLGPRPRLEINDDWYECKDYRIHKTVGQRYQIIYHASTSEADR
jgi:hypothetical protein